MAPKNNNQGPKKAHPKKVAKKITKRATKGKSTKPKVARKQPRTTETVGASKVIVPNASKQRVNRRKPVAKNAGAKAAQKK